MSAFIPRKCQLGKCLLTGKFMLKYVDLFIWPCSLPLVLYFSEMTFNTVFYQHPELVRKLNAHGPVMTVMVNIMSANISSEGTQKNNIELSPNSEAAKLRRKSTVSVTPGKR